MAQTNESKVKGKIDNIIKSICDKIVIVNPIGGMYTTIGVSDKLLCFNGYFVAIEAKSIQGKKRCEPTLAQYDFLRKVYSAGGFCAVVSERNLDVLEHWLTQVYEWTQGNLSMKPMQYISYDGCVDITKPLPVKVIDV